MIKQFLGLFIVAGFMCQCTHKASSYTFSDIQSVTVDESKVVLSRFPLKMQAINDSIIATLNSSQKLSLYNVYTGKNTLNLSLENIRFDSLIENTFRKKYEGIKKITYSEGYELNGENYQLTAFSFSDGVYSLHVSVIAEVQNLQDSADLEKKYKDNEKVKQIKKEYGETNIIEMDYLNFIFVTNNELKIKEIIPLYAESIIKKNNYYPYYQKQFFCKDNELYVPIGKMDEPFDKLWKKMNANPDNFCLAKLNLNDEKRVSYRLPLSQINFSDFTLQDYIAISFNFLESQNELLFSNGKEICDVETGKNLFSKQYLENNEWMDAFYKTEDNKLIVVNSTLDKKANVVQNQQSYLLDSISSRKIKLFDLIHSQWETTVDLPDIKSGICVAKNKIVYIDKDQDHYYFKYINYKNE